MAANIAYRSHQWMYIGSMVLILTATLVACVGCSTAEDDGKIQADRLASSDLSGPLTDLKIKVDEVKRMSEKLQKTTNSDEFRKKLKVKSAEKDLALVDDISALAVNLAAMDNSIKKLESSMNKLETSHKEREQSSSSLIASGHGASASNNLSIVIQCLILFSIITIFFFIRRKYILLIEQIERTSHKREGKQEKENLGSFIEPSSTENIIGKSGSQRFESKIALMIERQAEILMLLKRGRYGEMKTPYDTGGPRQGSSSMAWKKDSAANFNKHKEDEYEDQKLCEEYNAAASIVPYGSGEMTFTINNKYIPIGISNTKERERSNYTIEPKLMQKDGGYYYAIETTTIGRYYLFPSLSQLLNDSIVKGNAVDYLFKISAQYDPMLVYRVEVLASAIIKKSSMNDWEMVKKGELRLEQYQST